jgi:hypothetical protein
MANAYITGLPAADTLTGDEVLDASQLSSTVTITASTIRAQASDNSFNDSGSGFLAAGFALGNRVRVQGFTGDVANNLFVGVITGLSAAKMTIGGTDGDVIVDDSAGESVTISKWVSVRAAAQDIADLAAAGGDPLAPALPLTFNFTDAGDAYFYADEAMTLTEQATTGAGSVSYEKGTTAAPDTFTSTTSPVSLQVGAWLKVTADDAVAVHLKRTA